MNGLHAVAQPLTVLRAAIEMLARPEGAGMDQKRYLEILAAQVARTCDLFSCVRELVASNVIESQQASFDLWELLEPTIEDQTASLRNSGVGFAVMKQQPLQPIFGDAERTEQAFSALLKTAGALAAHGDVIELRASQAQGYAELTLLNPRSHGKQLNSTHRLGLSLAEVSILSQQGRYLCADDPFCCSFALPLYMPGQTRETSLPAAGLQPVHQDRIARTCL